MSDVRCECCGAKVVDYRFFLNLTLVGALRELAACNSRRGLSWFTPTSKHDMVLTHGEYGNFHKLAYFGLAVGHGGVWELTDLGARFLLGDGVAPSSVVSYRGTIIASAIERLHIDEVTTKRHYVEEPHVESSAA